VTLSDVKPAQCVAEIDGVPERLALDAGNGVSTDDARGRLRDELDEINGPARCSAPSAAPAFGERRGEFDLHAAIS
jgi:hypothetical protein